MDPAPTLSVNTRNYRLPTRPVVVVCIDGCAPRYLETALDAGALPAIARFQKQGCYRLARCAMPSFTNPNNLSIVTGVPPAVHGICGNYFYDAARGQEVMMNDAKFLRCETIQAALSEAGIPTVIITAKDKLRQLLGHGVRGICFSSEKADQVSQDENGIENVTELIDLPPPPVYSAQLSEYVLAAGLALLRPNEPQVMYLSLTDYVQHKHAPEEEAAISFHAMLDRYFDQFDRAGAVLGLVADHGMNRKARADGTPNVVYLRPILDDLVGPGQARIVLPITDPYVGHHGALGSFATVYLEREEDHATVRSRLASWVGVAAVLDGDSAAARFELPRDRIGDLVVVSDAHTALGKSPAEHDLSLLEGPLRSHGGLAEQIVPFLINRPLTAAYATRSDELRNFDIFDYVLNGTVQQDRSDSTGHGPGCSETPQPY